MRKINKRNREAQKCVVVLHLQTQNFVSVSFSIEHTEESLYDFYFLQNESKFYEI